MNIKQEIIKFANKHLKFQTKDLFVHFHEEYTRQYLSRILSRLIDEGQLVKDGSTKLSFYALLHNASELGDSLVLRLQNRKLEEHKVFEEVEKEFLLITRLPENVYSIFYYAFSEMLNNAIEHSQSKMIEIKLSRLREILTFEIRDFGIGVFKNIMSKRKLESELEAIQDLLKGKMTSAPKAHSGEGIFFTSKVADNFVLESHNLGLKVDNDINDVFVIDVERSKKGTKVTFQINMNSKKHLSSVFENYQTDPETFAFDKTEIKVRLYTLGTIYISRSQARRVLSGLDKFQSIILDFENVPTIGQAFADEIFRVFHVDHPEIAIESINTNKAVDFMIKRSKKTER